MASLGVGRETPKEENDNFSDGIDACVSAHGYWQQKSPVKEPCNTQYSRETQRCIPEVGYWQLPYAVVDVASAFWRNRVVSRRFPAALGWRKGLRHFVWLLVFSEE